MERNNARQRIYNHSGKLNDDDRQQLACLLIKAGYTARIGKATQEGTKRAVYFVEYRMEGDT